MGNRTSGGFTDQQWTGFWLLQYTGQGLWFCVFLLDGLVYQFFRTSHKNSYPHKDLLKLLNLREFTSTN